ncbi:MAG: hypothetical protein IJL22_03320 [Bacteroidales bacterium]|nr:hypothetical protein [Bacteroidales bacterium]
MRTQPVTSNSSLNNHTRYAPFVFTEQGVAMLSSVLKSNVAIQTNIAGGRPWFVKRLVGRSKERHR